METKKDWTTWWKPLALVATAVLLFVQRWLENTRNPDTFWHVATGRWIVTNGEVPHYDVFSWYAMSRHLKWIAQEWLFDVLAFYVHGAGGFVALNLAATLILVATFALIFRLILERTGSFAMALMLGYFCAYNLLPFSSARPNTLSLLLVAATLLLLEHDLWYLALGAMLLDVNLHGGLWPVYFVLIAIWAWNRNWKVIPLALAVPVLNPYGFEMYSYPFATLGVDLSGLVEWMPTTLSYKVEPLYLVAFALIVGLTDFTKIPWREALTAAAFTVLGLSASRNTPFWFVVVIPLLAPYMIERATWIVERVKEWSRPTALQGLVTVVSKQYLVLWAAVALVVAGTLWMQKAPFLQQYEWSVDSTAYPSDAVLRYLRTNGTTGTYTHYNVGGYLIYNNIPPFIDSRTDIYCAIDNPGETSYADVRATLKSITLEDFTAKYKIKTLVVPPGWSFDLAMRNNSRYELVFSDQTARIYKVVAEPSSMGM